MTERRYADPTALRRAVTDRLRTFARDQHAQLADLQRQFAYDRLLARLFLSEPDRWVLKGATALLARLGGAARHTLDVDLYRPGERLAEAEAALRIAAASDLGDFFRFVLAPGRRVAEGRDTIRIAVTAYVGATEFAAFHVDLVAGIAMTGEPDEARPLVPIDLPGIPAPTTACTRSPTTSPTSCAPYSRRTRARRAWCSRAPATATSPTWPSSLTPSCSTPTTSCAP
jgi:hypothetical protein